MKKLFISIFTGASLFMGSANATGFPTIDVANLTQSLMEYMQQLEDYTEQINQLDSLKNQYQQQMVDAAKPATDAFNTANKFINKSTEAYNYVKNLYGDFQSIKDFTENTLGDKEAWKQCVLSPSCNPTDFLNDVYRRIGDFAASGATIAHQTGVLLTDETQTVVNDMRAKLDGAQGANSIAETQAKNDIIMYQQTTKYQASVVKALAAINADIAAKNKEHEEFNTKHKAQMQEAERTFNESKVDHIYSTVLN